MRERCLYGSLHLALERGRGVGQTLVHVRECVEHLLRVRRDGEVGVVMADIADLAQYTLENGFGLRFLGGAAATLCLCRRSVGWMSVRITTVTVQCHSTAIP